MADIVAGSPSLRAKVAPFYSPSLDNLSKKARDLLESYSGVEPDRVVEHVMEIVRLLPTNRSTPEY